MKRGAGTTTTFTTTLNSKGQMVLPVPVRAQLGLKKGMHLNIILSEDENGDHADTIILQPLTPRLIRELRGSIKCAGAALDYLQEERKRDRERGSDETLCPRRECGSDIFGRLQRRQVRAKPY